MHKGKKWTLAALDTFTRAAGIDLGPHRDRFTNDDVFDELVSAWVAHLWASGRCHPVPSEHLEVARREGWIAVPDMALLTG